MIGDGVTTFAYSPRGTLAREPASGAGFEYTYDADGRRVRTERSIGVSQTIIHYLLPDGTPYFEDSSGAASNDRSLVFIGGRLLAAFKPGGTVTHIVSDHIGYPLLALGATGGVEWKAEGYPFGEIAELVQGSADYDPLLRYPGQWEPKGMAGSGLTTLFYNTHRWYHPGWGRYTQADPVGLRGGMNLFEYARGNPIGITDMLGLTPCSADCPECRGGVWFFYGVEGGFVADIWALGIGANVALFEARCVTSPSLVCTYTVVCARVFGLAAFAGVSGGGGLIFGGPCSDDLAGLSWGGDVDIAKGEGVSAGVDVGDSGTISVRGQGTLGLGAAATVNVCRATKEGCRRGF